MDGSKTFEGSRDHLLSETYRASCGQGSFSDVLTILANLTASEKSFLCRFSVSPGSGEINHSYNLTRSFISDYNRLAKNQNMWTKTLGVAEAEGCVWQGTDTPPSLRAPLSGAHTRLLRREGIEHMLHLLVGLQGDYGAIYVVLGRGAAGGDYGKDEIQIAEDFKRHAHRALEYRQTLEQNRIVEKAFTSVVEDVGLAIAVIALPRVIYASSNFQALLSSFVRNRRLPEGSMGHGNRGLATDVQLPSELIDAIASHNGEEIATLTIEQKNATRRLIVQIRPCAIEDSLHDSGGRAFAVLAYDAERRLSVNQDLLMAAFDLTRSEANVCALLAEGKSIDQIAKDVNISPHTARTHLQRVLKKTRSTRQAALITLALRTSNFGGISTGVTTPYETRPANGHLDSSGARKSATRS